MLRTTLTLFIAAGGLLAQTGPDIAVDLATADAVAVHANRVIDGARAGTAVDPALALQAHDGRHVAAGSRAAPEQFSTPRGSAPGARFAWHARATPGNVAGTLGGVPLAPAAQRYDLTLRARRAVQGDVVVLFAGDANGSRAGAQVRIGRVTKAFVPDGSAQREVFAGVTVDAGGLAIAVSGGGRAAPDRGAHMAGFRADLRVFFVADAGGGGCVQVGRRSCPEGGRLHGAVQRSTHGATLALDLQGALPDAFGLTLVSPTGHTFGVARTGCVFFADAVLVGTFRSDASGDARSALPLPMRHRAGFSVQQATLQITPRGLRFGSSNTLDVGCH